MSSGGTIYGNYVSRSIRETIMMPSPGEGTPTVTAIGDVPVIFGTFTVQPPDVSDGLLGDFQAAAFLNSKAGLGGDLNYARGLDIGAYIRFKLLQTTQCRMFIGFTDQSVTNMVSSDSPVGNYFGIQYSTSRGDTSFQIVRNDGTGMIKTSFIPVDTIAHDLLIRLFRDSGDSLCNTQIDDNIHNDFVSTIPGNATPLRFVAAIETLTASTKSIRVGRVSIKQNF